MPKKTGVGFQKPFASIVSFMDTVEGYGTDMPVIAFITTGDTEEIIQTGTEYRCLDPFIHDPNDTFNKETKFGSV